MPNEGSNNRSDFGLDARLHRAQHWILKNLLPIWFVFLIFAVLCFGVWLVTMLLFPAQDMRRERVTIPLDNNRTLVADYPKRFLADDKDRSIYLTADSSDPVSVTLELSQSLPLILVSAEPSSTIKIHDAAKGLLVVTWPLPAHSPISTTLTSSSGGQPSPGPSATPSAIAILPVLSQPNTVGLHFKNASSESGCWLFPFLAGFTSGSIKIVEAKGNGALPVKIETINRANWRVFAENYSFLAVLPFLVAAFGYLGKTYTDRQKSQREEGNKALDAFQQAISNAEGGRINASWKTLEKFSKYLSPDDWERAKRLQKFSTGELGLVDEATDFSTWADAWAGALILANGVLGPEENTSDAGQTTLSSGAQETRPDAAQPALHKIDIQAIYRYVRIFPIDQLSVSAEKRFRGFTAELDLIPAQSHDWPLPANSTPSYSKYPTKDERKAKTPLTIGRMDLFPANNADVLLERSLLFSQAAQWFWSGHPLHKEIMECGKSVLVNGKEGVGRTALALALTKYAKQNTRVLGAFHARPATLTDVQLGLATEMLRFARWRSSWLTHLERDERDLLAGLLLSALDAHYLLARLNEPEQEQLARNTKVDQKLSSLSMELDAPQHTVTTKDTEDKAASVGSEQVLLELRLLRQSVERMASKRPIPIGQWFLGLSYCAHRLDFKGIRVALDLTASDWINWRERNLVNFMRMFQIEYTIPTQLVLMVADDRQHTNVEPSGIIHAQELRWESNGSSDKDYLGAMLQYRAVQRGILEELLGDYLPAMSKLISAAQNNPRRLAELWQVIATKHKDDEQLIETMVEEAQEEVK